MTESNESNPTAPPADLACPHCGQLIEFTPAETPQQLSCPSCGGEFIAPAADGSIGIIDDEEPTEEKTPDLPEDELSAIRIRQIAAGRRATYRARSYCIIAAAVCAVATAQLAWMIVQQFRAAGWGMQCTGYALFASLGVWGVLYFLVRAARLHHEARQSSLTEFTNEPDFSTLDNGSKRVENLEDVH
jgi:hypothetical protein